MTETIRRPRVGRAGQARAKGLEKFPKFGLWVFISRAYRCDRVEQLGGTEMHNYVQLQQIGETEFFNLVGSRWFQRKPNPKNLNHI